MTSLDANPCGHASAPEHARVTEPAGVVPWGETAVVSRGQLDCSLSEHRGNHLPARPRTGQAVPRHGTGGIGPDYSPPLPRSNRYTPAPMPGWRRRLPEDE